MYLNFAGFRDRIHLQFVRVTCWKFLMIALEFFMLKVIGNAVFIAGAMIFNLALTLTQPKMKTPLVR